MPGARSEHRMTVGVGIRRSRQLRWGGPRATPLQADRIEEDIVWADVDGRSAR
jgi:hypothetical protein